MFSHLISVYILFLFVKWDESEDHENSIGIEIQKL